MGIWVIFIILRVSILSSVNGNIVTILQGNYENYISNYINSYIYIYMTFHVRKELEL